MADKRPTTAEAPKKSLLMITIPSPALHDQLIDAAKAANVSKNRYALDLIAKAFNFTLPEIRVRRFSSMRATFNEAYPRQSDETDEQYEKRYTDYKSQVQSEANKKRAERVKTSLDLMSQLKAAAEQGTLTELNLEELRAKLLAV